MTISEILKLNNDIDNLNIIIDFFDNSLSLNDYEQALNKYLTICEANSLDELALREGSKLLDQIIDQTPAKSRDLIYQKLFKAALNLSEFEKASKFINLRMSVLPEMSSYLTLIDKYHLDTKLGLNTYDLLNELKKEVIPLDVKVFVNEEILKYLIENELFDDAIKILFELKEDTLNFKYDYQLIKTYYQMKDYQRVINLSEQLIESSDANLESVVYYLAALRETNEFLKAENIESEYEVAFDNSSDLDLKVFAYEEIIKLYQKHYNKPSIDAYKNKLSKITRTSSKPKVKETIIVKPEVKEIKTTKLISHAKYLEHFEFINDWLVFSANLKASLSFREYLRTLFIEITSRVNLKEVIVYLDSSEDSNLFNYKNGRLYDKRIIKERLETTIFKQMIEDKKHLFGTPNNLLYSKDILTGANYSDDIKFVYGFYVSENFLISFYLDEEISDAAIYYELLLGIKTIINLRVLTLENQAGLIGDSKYLTSLLNNPIMPIRRLTNHELTYNEQAQKLFKIDRKYLLELWLRELSLVDAKMYEDTLNRLFNYPNESKIIKYQYQNLIILEYLYAYKVLDTTEIISFFIDITNSFKSEEALKQQVLYDSDTKLFSLNTFVNDFKELKNNKLTLMLIELDTSLKDIYGQNRTIKFFSEFAGNALKHFSDFKLYRYDFNKILVTLNVNDIRTINKIVDEYFIVFNHIDSHILKFEKFKTRVATLRYPVVSVDSNLDNLLKYLDLSLIKVRNEKKAHLDFTYSIYEEEVFEQQVIDYLNSAIENRQLEITFKQIIDLSENVVYQYLSDLLLPTINIDSSYVRRIAKKRGKLEELEYFHLELVLSFLRHLEDETKHLINISIPISQETFLKSDFEGYLIQTLKKYNISAKIIKLVIDGKLTDQTSLLKATRLIKYGVKLDTTKVSAALSADFSAVHLPLNLSTKKWISYVKNLNQNLDELNIKLIVTNVSSANDRSELKNLGVNYISGPLYKSVSPEAIIKQIKDRFIWKQL